MKNTAVFINLIPAIALLLSMYSCRREPSEGYAALEEIARNLEDQNLFDSAQSHFSAINPTTLRDNERHLYNLINSEIRYKNYKPATDDSMITVAADYFQRHNLTNFFIRAKLLESENFFEKEMYESSVISAMEGLYAAERVRDTLYMAKLIDLLAYNYHSTGNKKIYIERKAKAAYYYGCSGRIFDQRLDLVELASAYCDNMQYDKSILLCDSLLGIYQPTDSVLIGSTLLAKITPLIKLGKYYDALEIYNSTSEYPVPPGSSIYSMMAVLHLHLNDIKKAEEYLALASQENTWRGTQYFYLDALTTYYSYTGQTNELLNTLTELNLLNGAAMGQLMSHNILQTELEFQKKKNSEIREQSLRKEKSTKLVLLALISLLLSLIFIHLTKIRKKNRLIREKIDILQDLSDRLNESKKIFQENSIQMETLVKELFNENLNTLNKLGYHQYTYGGSALTQKNLLIQLENTIQEMASPEKLHFIENGLNQIYDNLMIKLREQVPALTNGELTFLIYFYAGIDPRTISLLMKIELRNVYNRRTRSKQKITNSDAKDKELFLAPFSR